MVLREIVKPGEGAPAGDFLARKSGLPLSVIQDALLKGAFRLKRRGQKWIRLRKMDTAIGPGDEVAFYYDRDILARIPPAADLVEDRREYTVWFKPSGLMTRGSPGVITAPWNGRRNVTSGEGARSTWSIAWTGKPRGLFFWDTQGRPPPPFQAFSGKKRWRSVTA